MPGQQQEEYSIRLSSGRDPKGRKERGRKENITPMCQPNGLNDMHGGDTVDALCYRCFLLFLSLSVSVCVCPRSVGLLAK